ncbi:arylsulfotransferase family protein [Actinoplanes missouriensis]|uniref:arylsulfotransferase family protein n=1 Tax=Actinoplanes missouriensis TaxID=1866 RepID=UPI0002F4419A|nr:arylsulfotransferase family protein [Actinoplanes missouriensis]
MTISRRTLILGSAAAAVAAGGGGYLAGRSSAPATTAQPGTSPAPAAPAAQYRSRPDLDALPDVTITTPASKPSGEFVFLTPFAGSALRGPLIVDEQGSPVWFRKVPDPATVAIDFKPQTYRGKPVLTWWEGTIGGTGGQGVGQGEFVVADQAYREITRIRATGTEQADQHDLVLTDRGTALFWVYDPVAYDLTALGGPADGVLHDGVLQEVDVATGRKVFEWRARDHIGVAESYAPLPQGDSSHLPYDYLHPNSVSLDADGHLLLSARHTWAVYKVHRRTGEVLWRIGGKKSGFQVDERSAFSWQHDFQRRRDGSYSVFDNGAGITVEKEYSRGLVFRVDEKAEAVTFVAEYVHPDRISAPTQGNFRELADGGSFVGWGQQPHFTEHDADGRVRLAGHLPGDNQSYRAYKARWAAAAQDQPALGLRVEGGNTIVSASWNGHTGVRRWRARAGGQPGRLAASAEADRAGFETSFPVAGIPEYVVAEALDETGQVLGSSSAIPVRV